jgi:hypothetical protein
VEAEPLTYLAVIVAVVVLDLAALRWGADSRDGRDWKAPGEPMP